MKKCSKCKEERNDDEYYTYWHSTQQKYRTRHICNFCTRKQSKEYKLNRKNKQVMLEEIVPTKYCPGCKKEIPMTGYYKSNANAGRYCISCLRKNYEEKKYKEIMSNGGSERISPKPNTYVDEFQKAQTFMVLERLGWIYNDNGVWSKEGVKDKDNNWVDIIPQPKVKRRPTGVLIKKKHGVHKYIDKIIQQREEEKMTYADLADIYDCSHTTIRMIVSKYYNEKKTR